MLFSHWTPNFFKIWSHYSVIKEQIAICIFFSHLLLLRFRDMQKQMLSCFTICNSYIQGHIHSKFHTSWPVWAPNKCSQKTKKIINEINLFRDKQGSWVKLIKTSVLTTATTANAEKQFSVLILLLTKLWDTLALNSLDKLMH